MALSGIADALRNIDCVSAQAVETAFARLFGSSGGLSQALTAVLTIYVALLALNLLTGRAQLRLNMLTPRMLHVGLVLTLATSWAAYQTVAWNVLAAAPDEIASILLGTRGSATQLFAQRLDVLFDVITQSAHLAQSAPAQATVGIAPAVANTSPKPADLLWLASLMLLLGTVGVLIVARIALAAVMGLGPVFIVLALFRGTRGLFEGWVKAALMMALTPLLAVLIGGGTLAMAAPMIRSLSRAGGQVSLGLAANIFVAAFVYLSLMVLALRAAAMITGSWHLGSGGDPASAGRWGGAAVRCGHRRIGCAGCHADRPVPSRNRRTGARSGDEHRQRCARSHAGHGQCAAAPRLAPHRSSLRRPQSVRRDPPGGRPGPARAPARARLPRSAKSTRMTRILALVLMLSLPAGAALADQRIEQLDYSPDRVYTVTGQRSIQTMIEFAADETIENIALGDAAAWQVTPNKRANLIFVKPLLSNTRTNMTVVTDKRRYLFELVNAGPNRRQPFAIRFVYPEDRLAAALLDKQVDTMLGATSAPPLRAATRGSAQPELEDYRRQAHQPGANLRRWRLDLYRLERKQRAAGDFRHRQRWHRRTGQFHRAGRICRGRRSRALLRPAHGQGARSAHQSFAAPAQAGNRDAGFSHAHDQRGNPMIAQQQYDAPGDPRSSLAPEALADAGTSGYPVVASQFARRDRAGLMLGASIALLLGAATLFAMSSSRQQATAPQPLPSESPPAELMAPAPAMLAPAPLPAPAPLAPMPAPAVMPQPFPPPPAMPAGEMVPDRVRAPAVILDNGPAGAGAMAGATPVDAKPARAPREGMTPEEQFALRLGIDAEGVTAQRLQNPAATVAQGTLMTAVLETAINSDLPGYARAVVSQDVKSYDGKRVLIPRGTRLIGEYKSGLTVGQSRAYILWTRLLRPDGVSLALASPATDFAGRNGLGGKVDSHFFKRFGSAILLSVIGAAGQAAGGGNSTVVLAGPQQAVAAGAQRDINIPPTIKVALGQPIRIFTARDLDFSTVSDTR